jgi:hypothetical protein
LKLRQSSHGREDLLCDGDSHFRNREHLSHDADDLIDIEDDYRGRKEEILRIGKASPIPSWLFLELQPARIINNSGNSQSA